MIEEILQKTENRMKNTVESLKRELAVMRTGRASAAMLEPVKIDYYGSKSPINQVANVSIPEARLIVIKPWDKNMIEPIKKAIQSSDLGLNPADDGNVIRLQIPPLTEESRKNLVKIVRQYGEEAKISIRNIRRDSNADIKDFKNEGEIAEDDCFKGLDKIQKKTDDYVKNIDQIIEHKEKEVMQV